MSHDAPSAAYPPPPGGSAGVGAAPYGGYPTAPPVGYPDPGATGQAPYAGWLRRVGANLLDTLVDLSPYLPTGILAAVTAEPTVDSFGNATTAPSAAGGLALMLGMVLSLAVTFWNRWWRQGRTGRSVGKGALGMRLLSAQTGRPIGAGMAFGRDIAHVVDGIFYLGYLWPLWDPQKQTFADKIVGSVVVRDR